MPPYYYKEREREIMHVLVTTFSVPPMIIKFIKNLTSFPVSVDSVPVPYQDKLLHLIPHHIFSYTLQNLFSLPLFHPFSLCILTWSSIFIIKWNKTINKNNINNKIFLQLYFLVKHITLMKTPTFFEREAFLSLTCQTTGIWLPPSQLYWNHWSGIQIKWSLFSSLPALSSCRLDVKEKRKIRLHCLIWAFVY